MPRPKIFIDGSAGTTGLRIRDWLAPREDLDLIVLAYEDRRDPDARQQAISDADLAVLCLPDDAAIEASDWAVDSDTKVLDPSTAHRVADGWVYGLPEMDESTRDAVAESQLVSNPGCYATAVVLLLKPLVDEGLIPSDVPISVHGLSGYSGGGRIMIERWQGGEPELTNLPFESPYALTAVHKHIAEMTKYSGLTHQPQFVPAVGPFITGMRLEIPLHKAVLSPGTTAQGAWSALEQKYFSERFVKVTSLEDESNFVDPSFDPRACNDTNRIDLSVVPNASGNMLLVAQLDNLGKGAAGAAIQNLNLMLGLPEATGLPS